MYNATIGNASGSIGKAVEELSSGNLLNMSDSTLKMVDKAIKVVDTLAKLHNDSEMEKLRRDLARVEEELANQEKVAEESKYTDVWLEAIRTQGDVLTQLQGMTEMEQQYEPVVSTMHSGCSQRTSHLALMGMGTTTFHNNLVRKT
jgi:Iap family predicted aminopeptidase